MFIVLVMGATVTKTGSGEECGTTWPLCHGKFVPAHTIGSVIEFSHRFVSGIVGLMVLAVCIWVFRKLTRKDARLYAGAALFFTVLQAILGALAVKQSQSDLVMALHFGFSLLAFAGTLLLAITVSRLHLPAHPSGWGEAFSQNDVISPGLRRLIWFVTVYCYVVVYTGAYVRHTESMGGCLGFPLCNGEVIPELSGASGIAFIHRVAAVLMLVVTLWMSYRGMKAHRHHSAIYKACLWSIILVIAQISSGVLVVFTLAYENVYLFTALLHSTIIAGLFGVLCYLSILAWQLRKADDHVPEAAVKAH